MRNTETKKIMVLKKVNWKNSRQIIFLLLFALSSFAYPLGKRPTLSEELESRYMSGLQYIKDGNFSSAVEEFYWLLNQAEVQKTPYYHSKVLYWLAESLFSLGKYREAFRFYNELLTTYPKSKLVESAMYGAGKSAYMSGDLTNSVRFLSLYIAKYDNIFSREDDCLFYLGKAYLSMGDKLRAVELFKQIVDNYPSSPYAYEVRDVLEELKREGLEKTMEISNKMVELVSKESNIVEIESKLKELKSQLEEEKKKLDMEREALSKLFKILEQKERLLKLKEKKLKALEYMGFGKVK